MGRLREFLEEQASFNFLLLQKFFALRLTEVLLFFTLLKPATIFAEETSDAFAYHYCVRNIFI